MNFVRSSLLYLMLGMLGSFSLQTFHRNKYISILQYSRLPPVATFPSSRLFMVCRSLSGNNPVFRAEPPLALFSLHITFYRLVELAIFLMSVLPCNRLLLLPSS